MNAPHLHVLMGFVRTKSPVIFAVVVEVTVESIVKQTLMSAPPPHVFTVAFVSI
jgi:hypothetical protein